MFKDRLYAFEREILSGIGSALADDLSDLYSLQIERINKVQRLLEWNEIEFYCMSFFKVRWPDEILFKNKKEFILGEGVLSSGENTANITVWSVGGHVFSIESERPLKPFRSLQSISFILTEGATQQGAPGDAKMRRN